MGCCVCCRARDPSWVGHQIFPAPSDVPPGRACSSTSHKPEEVTIPADAGIGEGSPGDGAPQEANSDSSSDEPTDESMLSPEQVWLHHARRQAKSKRRRERRQQAEQSINGATCRGWSADGASTTDTRGGFDFHYALGHRIGKGAFATICSCTHVSTNTVRAVKTIDRRKFGGPVRIDREVRAVKPIDLGAIGGPAAMAQLDREVLITGEVSHPNIVKCIDSFKDEKYVHIVMEIYAGGSLHDCIMTTRGVPQDVAAHLARQMAEAVKYLHAHFIAHRDVKPENFMLADASALPRASIKMIDFGFARYFQPGEGMETIACSPGYVAPEVLAGRYTQACDIWSLGVVFYVLLSGVAPFPGRSEAEVLEKVKLGKFDFGQPAFSSVGDAPRDLIRSMIRLDVKTRIAGEALLKHRWLNSWPRIRIPWRSWGRSPRASD